MQKLPGLPDKGNNSGVSGGSQEGWNSNSESPSQGAGRARSEYEGDHG